MSHRAAILLIFALCATAQTQNGNILGTGHDQSGAVEPGVRITAEDERTGVKRETRSAEDGTYRLESLPKGTYNITAEASGFKRFIGQGVELATAQTLRDDVGLEVGQ